MEEAAAAARAMGLRPEESEAWQAALTRLRAHTEVCDDCFANLFVGFAETKGKNKTVVNLSEGEHE